MCVDNLKHSYCPRCNESTFFLIINHRSGSAIESSTGDQGVVGRHCVSYVFKGWVLTLFLCFPCVFIGQF